jgi:hypothetical protein
MFLRGACPVHNPEKAAAPGNIFGGLLIMMGHHARAEALFYSFRLEDQVPETHLLRPIDKHISFVDANYRRAFGSWHSSS